MYKNFNRFAELDTVTETLVSFTFRGFAIELVSFDYNISCCIRLCKPIKSNLTCMLSAK